jgi:hypothetical protein
MAPQQDSNLQPLRAFVEILMAGDLWTRKRVFRLAPQDISDTPFRRCRQVNRRTSLSQRNHSLE